jgi:NhaP-type Na+/H+ or K+/H+ antiporter
MLIAVNSAFLGFLSSKDILMMAAVLASIDPIAAVPLIKDSHGRLAAVVSGEGVINSAVVIILFGTIAGINEFSQEYS